MELKVFWRTLLRRWYLTLAVLALTIGATAYVVGRVGPTYEAEGSALVFPPVSSTQSEGTRKTIGNPYLELAGVGQARDVIIRTMKSRTVQSSWGAAFPGMSYEAIPDFTNSAPIILFTVEGDTADGATAGLDDLMARIPLILDELQDGLGLPPDAYVTARKLTQDTRPAVERKTQIRAGLLTAAVAGGLGLLLLALVDSLLGVRARVRAEQEAADEVVPPENDPPAEVAAEAPPAENDPPAEVAAEPPPAENDPPAEVAAEPPPAEDDPPAEVAAEAPPAEDDPPAEATEEDPATEPVYVKRVLVDAELAVSPARSRWPIPITSAQPTGSGKRFRTGDSGPHAPVPPTRPMKKATGRNP